MTDPRGEPSARVRATGRRRVLNRIVIGSPTFISSTLGEVVADARRAAGLSVKSAARSAGIDSARWRVVESGEVDVTLHTLYAIGDAVDIAALTLLARAETRIADQLDLGE